MAATIHFSRGFAMPRQPLHSLSNPLSIGNLYAKGGRIHDGKEEGVSFGTKLINSPSETPVSGKGEYYARRSMANKEGYMPVVVSFDLTEGTFPLLKGKLGTPKKLMLGSKEIVIVEPIPAETFTELQTYGGREIIVQGAALTLEELQQLNIRIGTADIGKEGQPLSLIEAISSNAEFTYTSFEANGKAVEGENHQLGENGGLMK